MYGCVQVSFEFGMDANEVGHQCLFALLQVGDVLLQLRQFVLDVNAHFGVLIELDEFTVLTFLVGLQAIQLGLRLLQHVDAVLVELLGVQDLLNQLLSVFDRGLYHFVEIC